MHVQGTGVVSYIGEHGRDINYREVQKELADSDGDEPLSDLDKEYMNSFLGFDVDDLSDIEEYGLGDEDYVNDENEEGEIEAAAESPKFEKSLDNKHEYGCLMAILPPAVSKQITDWAIENIPDFHLTGKGRELRPHVTIKYGFKDSSEETIQAIRAMFGRGGPFTLQLTGVSLFQKGYGKWDDDEGDVLKIDVESPELHGLNAQITNDFDTETKYPEYIPHVTIAYLKPEVSGQYLSMRYPFLNQVVQIDEVEYSRPDGTTERIPLSFLKLSKALQLYHTKDKQGSSGGTCKQGERSDLTGCVPADGQVSARKPKAQQDPNDLSKIGGAGRVIADHMYDAMYEQYEKGKTTEAGAPSVYLQVAKMVKDSGRSLTKDEFISMVGEVQKAKSESTGAEYQEKMKGIVNKWAKKEPQKVERVNPDLDEFMSADESKIDEKAVKKSIDKSIYKLAASKGKPISKDAVKAIEQTFFQISSVKKKKADKKPSSKEPPSDDADYDEILEAFKWTGKKAKAGTAVVGKAVSFIGPLLFGALKDSASLSGSLVKKMAVVGFPLVIGKKGFAIWERLNKISPDRPKTNKVIALLATFMFGDRMNQVLDYFEKRMPKHHEIPKGDKKPKGKKKKPKAKPKAAAKPKKTKALSWLNGNLGGALVKPPKFSAEKKTWFAGGQEVKITGGEFAGQSGKIISKIPKRYRNEQDIWRILIDGYPKPGGWDGVALVNEKWVQKKNLDDKGLIDTAQAAGEWLARKWQALEDRYGRWGALVVSLSMLAPLPAVGFASIAIAEGIRKLSGYSQRSAEALQEAKKALVIPTSRFKMKALYGVKLAPPHEGSRADLLEYVYGSYGPKASQIIQRVDEMGWRSFLFSSGMLNVEKLDRLATSVKGLNYSVKDKQGTCEQGERADLTGCIPASGEASAKKPKKEEFGTTPEREAREQQRQEKQKKRKAPPPEGERITKPPCCLYDPDPYEVDPETGVTKMARVGVPAMSVPPPPKEIPRLPDLTDKERAAESRFAEAYLDDPDGVVDDYRSRQNHLVGYEIKVGEHAERMAKEAEKAGIKAIVSLDKDPTKNSVKFMAEKDVLHGFLGENVKGSPIYEIGDAPNIFNTDDAKLLSPDYNPMGVSDDDAKSARGVFNAAVHQTSNAIAKRAFVKYLDSVVMKLPEEKRTVLVTSGGVASGKGYALKSTERGKQLSNEAAAIWDAAGEQNATENPWILEECKKRGIKTAFAFIHADPSDTWENPKRGVVERANKIGRMVDARLFSDSYTIGAKNFQAFYEKNKDAAEFIILHNRTGQEPELLDKVPDEALSVTSDQIYKRASQVLDERAEKLRPSVVRGGSIGRRVWGEPE